MTNPEQYVSDAMANTNGIVAGSGNYATAGAK